MDLRRPYDIPPRPSKAMLSFFTLSPLFHCESTYFSAPLSAPKTYLAGVQQNQRNQLLKVPHSTPPSRIKDLRPPAPCTLSVHSLYSSTMDKIDSWSFVWSLYNTIKVIILGSPSHILNILLILAYQ